MPTAAILILSGLGCLLICGLTAYKTYPREGRPESAWTKTENRTMVLVMFMLLLLFGGITLLLKGIL